MIALSVVLTAGLVLVLLRARSGRALATAASMALFVELAFFMVFALARTQGASAFDESVVYHLLNGYRGAPRSIVLPLLATTAVLLAVLALFCRWILRHARRRQHGVAAGGVLGALLAASFVANPVTLGLLDMGWFRLTNSAEPPPEYRPPTRARFHDKPNIVYIYLESLERSFLDPHRFPDLAPNLRKLESQAIHFTDIRPSWGSGWTIAGMVASQCGLPLSTDVWNAMSGLDDYLGGARCLGDVLAEQGYALHYLGGADSAFSGKGAFYRTHGFSRVQGQEELSGQLDDPSYQNEWGLYDDTLFALVRQRFDRLAQAGQPFGLFMLTNGTHHPDGNLSRDCETGWGKAHAPLLDGVRCTDRHVAGLVRHIRNSPAGANTLIVIGSDHLAMRSRTADTWLRDAHRRNLLMVLTPDGRAQAVDKPGSTLDVAATLLGLVSDVHAVGLGRDLRASGTTLAQDKPNLDRFLKRQARFLATLWQFPSLADGATLRPAEGKIQIDARSVDLPVLFLLDRELAVQDLVFPGRHDFFGLSAYVARLPARQLFLWIDRCAELGWLASSRPDRTDTRFCQAAGSTGSASMQVQPVGDADAALDLDALRSALATPSGRRPHASLRPTLAEIKKYQTANRVTAPAVLNTRAAPVLVAGAAPHRPFFIQGMKETTWLKPGVNVLAISDDGQVTLLDRVDPCKEPERMPRRRRPPAATLVVAAAPALGCAGRASPPPPRIRAATLTQWQQAAPDDAYVAVIPAGGPAVEYLIPAHTSLAVHLESAGTD